MGLLVAGTGSFAAEMADWARAAGETVDGLIELRDRSRVGRTFHGLPALGIDAVAPATPTMIGVGGDRRATWRALATVGLAPCTIVHPAAVIGGDAVLEPGVTIGPLAVIGAATVIGTGTIVSRGSLVGHHVAIGAYATLNPGVNLGGNTQIGAGAFIGMGAVVVNGVTIGDGAVVGAGAVVLHDVPGGERVQGIPARAPLRSV